MDDLNVCLDEKYLPIQEIETLKSNGWRVHKLINGYGRYLRCRKSESAVLHDLPQKNQPTDEDDPF
jgi:hypothetical protein